MILYSTVVSAYAAVGDMANARRVVAEMSDRRVRPNDRTFAHLAWGYGQLGDVAGVTQTAQLMVDEGVSMRPGGSGRQALVRAVRECGLPASHVDRLLDSLAPRRKGAGSRSGVGSRGGRRRARRIAAAARTGGCGARTTGFAGRTAPTRRQRRRRRRRRRRHRLLRSTTPSRLPRRRSRGGRAGTATVGVAGR